MSLSKASVKKVRTGEAVTDDLKAAWQRKTMRRQWEKRLTEQEGAKKK